MDMKQKIVEIPYTTVEAGLREAEMVATRNAATIATTEYHHRRQGLVQVEHGLDASIAELEASGTELEAAGAKKKAEARALKPKARTAHAAIAAEDTAHSKFMFRFNSHSNRMDPPPPPSKGNDRRCIQLPPQPHGTPPPPSHPRTTTAVTSNSADSWATVTSRSHPAPPHPDDAYLEIRVLSFRFHNEHLPEDVQNQIFDLSTTVYTALNTMHHSKAPLRFARDLASQECSPLRPEIVAGIFTLCDVVRWAYNSGADRNWFANTTRNSQATAPRKPHTKAERTLERSG